MYDARFVCMVEQLRMQIVALVGFVFVHFQGNAVRVGPRVLANAGDLSGNLDTRFVRLDREGVVTNFRCDDGLGKLTNDRQLIAEVAVQGLEPVG